MDNVQITFAKAREDAEALKSCANDMRSIFSDVEATMKRVGCDDVFAGDASLTLQQRFDELKPKFDLYVEKVNEFAADAIMAADKEEESVTNLQSQAEQLTRL